MNKKAQYVNIPVKPQTYHELAQLGDLTDTFDTVVKKLVESYLKFGGKNNNE